MQGHSVTVTKKQFEHLLNEHYGFDDQQWGQGGNRRARNRPYGTYLRSADKEMFDMYYAQYLEQGDQWFT